MDSLYYFAVKVGAAPVMSFNSIEWIRYGVADSGRDSPGRLSIPLNGFGKHVKIPKTDPRHPFNSIEWIHN